MSENVIHNSRPNGFSQAQIDSLSSLHFINKIDQHLRIISSINLSNIKTNAVPHIMLVLEIYYENHQMGDLSFNLHNYEYEDIIAIAKNIRSNEFILQEVDNFLSGDVVE